MFYVYVLSSLNQKEEIYIGFSSDLKKRIKDHNKGFSTHTAKFKPWKIIYASIFADKQKALLFEKYLKTASGKAFMRKRLL